MSNTILDQGLLDTRGERLQPYFLNDDDTDVTLTSARWYCTEVTEGLGSEAATATIIIPLSAGVNEESAYSLVFNSIAMRQFRHGTPALVYARRYLSDGTTLNDVVFAGRIVRVKQIVWEAGQCDAVEILCKDVRDQLKDVRIIGRWIYDPKNFSAPQYQEGWGAHFNPGGRPNCIYDERGNPYFTPYPDFGLQDDEEVPDPSNPADCELVATYWTLSAILLYLWNFHGPDATLDTNFPYLHKCSSILGWDSSFGSSIDTTAEANFDTGTGQNFSGIGGGRKGRDMNIDGLSLVGENGSPGVFDMIFAAAGGWSWRIEYNSQPEDEQICNLACVPSRWNGTLGGVDIPYAAGGPVKNVMGKRLCVTGGVYVESSENSATRIAATSGIIKIETRINTNLATPASASLLPAWTDEEYYDCLDDACSLASGNPTVDSCRKAFSRHPNVMTKWVLAKTYDFQVGTQESGMPRATIARPIWPTLLSFQGTSEEDPTDTNYGGIKTGDIVPYPTRTEYLDSTSTWQIGPEADGMEVFDNGMISISGLRDRVLNGLGGCFRFTSGDINSIPTTTTTIRGVVTTILDITQQDIRMTVAIPCDHRLSYYLKGGSDQSEEGTEALSSLKASAYGDGPDDDKMDSGFTRTIYMDLKGLYQLWYRYGSYPEPEAAGGTMFPNRTSSAPYSVSAYHALRNDTQLLQNHTLLTAREKVRLARDGPVRIDGGFATAYPVGTMVNNFVPLGTSTAEPFQARFVVGRRRFFSDLVSDENGNQSFKNGTELYPQ